MTDAAEVGSHGVAFFWFCGASGRVASALDRFVKNMQLIQSLMDERSSAMDFSRLVPFCLGADDYAVLPMRGMRMHPTQREISSWPLEPQPNGPRMKARSASPL